MNSVYVILPDKKPERYMISPNMTVKDVLSNICQKHNLDPSLYVLSYKNYFLSKPLLFSTFNFYDDEVLTLEKDFRPTSNESVKVSFRIKDSNISAHFNPDVSLWRIVESLVASVTLQIPYSTPILIRKKKEFIGYDELSRVTLRSLGVTNGKIYFRFSIIEDNVLSRRTGAVLGSTESMQFELTKNFDTSSSFTHRIVSSDSVLRISHDEAIVTLAPGILTRGSSVFEEIFYLGDRNALAFRLPDGFMVYPRESDNEFYELPADDVTTMYQDLQRQRMTLQERAILHTRDRYQSFKKDNLTVVRIQFPDRTVLQGVFDAKEKIKEIKDFVERYRRVASPFQLGPSKILLDSDKTIDTYGLGSHVKIYYKVASGDHPARTAYLNENVLRNLTSHQGACYTAANCNYEFPDQAEGGNLVMSKSNTTMASDQKLKSSFSQLDSSEKKGFMLRPFKTGRLHSRH